MYLLDTNAVIRYLNGRAPKLADRWDHTRRTDLYLCSIVKAELFHGAYKSARVAENLRTIFDLFDLMNSVGFTDACADTYGKLTAELQQAGTPIGTHDLQIATIAIINGMTLITANTREFGRIPGLRLENWEV